ncbi:MAG TPA: hypothetical protein PK760_02770 [Flavobacteriales bacterium]|nr:hypothetical protein [Flavobacteriales bacterium]
MTLLRNAASAITLFATALAFAQVPEHKVDFLKRPENWSIYGEDLCTDQYQIDLERITTGKQKGMISIYVADRATGAQVGKTTFSSNWEEDHHMEKLMQVNGKVYAIYDVVNMKTAQVDVYAQEIAVPQPEFVGDRKPIASVKFEPRGFYFPGKLFLRFHTSANGQYTAFFFDAIRSKEDEQLVLVTMLDKDLEKLWEQAYRIEFDSEKVSTVSVVVSDQGVVYSLMNARFKNRSITNKSVNFDYQVFGMTQTGMANQLIDVGAGLSAVACDLALRKGTIPVVGGFHVEEGTSTEITRGYFIGELDPALAQPTEVHATTFQSEVQERMRSTDLFVRSDGGAFLTGLSRNSASTSMSESYLFAGSFDKNGEQEWATIVPRTLVASKSDEDYGYRAFFAKDKLMVLLPDREENLANYRNRSELEKVRKGPYIPLIIGFSSTGEASYAKLGAPADYSFFVNSLQDNTYTQNGTFAFSCSKKTAKKELNGTLFIDFE